MELLKPVQGSKYLIVYHREDNDGLVSMAIIRNYLINHLEISPDDIELFGANYEEMNKADIDEWIKKYNSVIMTDISLPLAKMKKLYKEFGNNFVWIDHHAPIIKECDENKLDVIPGSRLIDRSAILNAYEFLYNPFHLSYDDVFNEIVKPEFLIILSAFDSFTFEKWGYNKKFVEDVNTAVTNEFNLEPGKVIEAIDMYMSKLDNSHAFKEWENDLIYHFYNKGRDYNKIQEQIKERTVKEFGSEFKVDKDRKGCVLFIQNAVGSQWFECVKDEYQNGIIFKRMKTGRWIISLYNIDNDDKSFNCGEYLRKKYGGGGHLGAAGCQVDEETFIKILKSKKL